MDYLTKSLIGTGIISLMAIIGYLYTPKSRSAFGYKSPMSLKNDTTWNYANNLSKKLFVGVVILFVVIETLSIEKVMHNSYRFTNNKAETRSGFKLFNFDGVLVLEGAISDSITNIDVSKLRKGQYILKIHQDGYENTQHIIIN